MTLFQAKELERLLALYWAKKSKKQSTKKVVEEMVVLLSQINLSLFKAMMEGDPDE